MKRFTVACALLVAIVASAGAGEVSLPYANFGGYTTTLVELNPTAEPITVPTEFIGATTYLPGAVVRTPDWPAANSGGGVAVLSVPLGIVAYVEIRDPHGVRVRIGDVGPARERAALYDLLTGRDGFASYLFIHSRLGTALEIAYGSGATASYTVAPDATIVVRAPDGETSAVVTAGGSWAGFYGRNPVRVFGLVSRQPRGELFAVTPY